MLTNPRAALLSYVGKSEVQAAVGAPRSDRQSTDDTSAEILRIDRASRRSWLSVADRHAANGRDRLERLLYALMNQVMRKRVEGCRARSSDVAGAHEGDRTTILSCGASLLWIVLMSLVIFAVPSCLDRCVDNSEAAADPIDLAAGQRGFAHRVADLGLREIGCVVPAEFILRNTGEGDVSIRLTQKSCSCVDAELVSSGKRIAIAKRTWLRIPAGGQSEICLRLRVTSALAKGALLFETTCAALTSFKVACVCRGYERHQSTGEAQIGDVQPGQELSTEVSIKSVAGCSDLEVVGVSCDPSPELLDFEVLECSVLKDVERGETRLALSLRAPISSGAGSGVFKIRWREGPLRFGALRVPFTFRILSPVEILGRRIVSLGRFESGDAVACNIFVVPRRSGETLELRRARFLGDRSYLRADISSITDRRGVSVEARLVGPIPSGVVRGHVILDWRAGNEFACTRIRVFGVCSALPSNRRGG